MQSTTDLAVHILARTPARALPISHLSLLIEQDIGGATVEDEFVVQAVRSRPDLFRLLDPWRGPWRVSRRPGLAVSKLDSRLLRDVKDEPWVLLLAPPTENQANAPLRMLQDSMVAAGRRVDEHSVMALARWLRMTIEVGDVAPALQRISG